MYQRQALRDTWFPALPADKQHRRHLVDGQLRPGHQKSHHGGNDDTGYYDPTILFKA